MRSGAEAKSHAAAPTEEMFREAIELANRVTRRISESDVRRDRDGRAREGDRAER